MQFIREGFVSDFVNLTPSKFAKDEENLSNLEKKTLEEAGFLSKLALY